MGIATRAEEQGPRAAGMRLGRVGARGRHAALSAVRDRAEAAMRAEEQGPRPQAGDATGASRGDADTQRRMRLFALKGAAGARDQGILTWA